jgi:tRNA modification GTPase
MREGRRAGIAAAGFAPDTIFAPATGTGRAAIAIIRISGPLAHHAVCRLAGDALPPWRMLTLCELRAHDGAPLDRAMVVAFPEGASYTGERMAEIHCHGSRAVVADLMVELSGIDGCRLAEPGEFTRRALENGRMDLTEAEGLADLIDAETSQQRRHALRTHAGAVSRQTEAWRASLLRARGLTELTIDWADEEIPEDVLPEVGRLLRELQAGMEVELSRSGPAERMRAGFEVAIVGPPNVGKSSLLNAIAQRDAAIVSEIAGTTRDVIELRFDLGGLPVVFLDTAGIREARDKVEGIGIERARRRAGAADVRLLLTAPDVANGPDTGLWREGDIRVWMKCDLGLGEGDVSVSTLDGSGLTALLDMLAARLEQRSAGAGILGHVRQRLAAEQALGHVRNSLAMLDGAPAEHLAEELRLASTALDRLVGRIGVEDVLGEVFGSFCLGK